MWCTMVALFSWIFKVFYSFRAFAVERYIPSPARILSWNNAIGRLLYPSWWCLVPLVRNDRFFCDVSFARGPSVYLAKGQCIALFFSFTILVFTTSLPRVTPHPFVFFYIINIFLEMLNQHLYLSFSFRHFFLYFFRVEQSVCNESVNCNFGQICV